MTTEKIIDYFLDELEPYINFNENTDLIYTSQKGDNTYHIYLTDIKDEFLSLSLGHSSIVIKELSSRQADIYQKLSTIWHPYLETVYGVFRKDGHLISINEFIEAPKYLDCEERSLTLEEYITRYGCFSEKDALLLLCQLCDGVDTLQKLNLTHGDISPQNILLTDPHSWTFDFGQPPNRHRATQDITKYLSLKIIDFDITSRKKVSNHEVTTIVGTSSFAAPEILDYRYPSDRIDIYSLGCILHYMIKGKSPKDSNISDSVKEISTRTFRIIEHCTAAYEIRYGSAAKLKKAILHELERSENPFLIILYKIPGFRTRKLWKMAIALLFYGIYLIYPSILAILNHRFFDKNTFIVMLFFIISIILVCDTFHLGNLSPRYTYQTSKYPLLQYFVKLAILVQLFFFFVIISVFI